MANKKFGKQANETFSDLNKKMKKKMKNIKYRYGIDLSEEFSVPKNIEDFESRSDYFAFKKQASRFLDKKNDEYKYMKNKFGIVISRKQFKEVQDITNERRAKAIAEAEAMKNLPYIEGGEVISTLGKVAETTSIEQAMGITMPKKFDRETFGKIRDQRTIEAKIKGKDKFVDPEYYDQRKIQMQQNYIELMFYVLDQDNEEHLKTLKLVQEMNPNDFYNMYHSNVEALRFEMYPSPKKHAKDGKIPSSSQMRYAINKYQTMKDNDLYQNF